VLPFNNLEEEIVWPDYSFRTQKATDVSVVAVVVWISTAPGEMSQAFGYRLLKSGQTFID
jgi:hypothetical protein